MSAGSHIDHGEHAWQSDQVGETADDSSLVTAMIIRAFVEKSYLGIKEKNPHLPILVREALGTPPRAFARFGEGAWQTPYRS